MGHIVRARWIDEPSTTDDEFSTVEAGHKGLRDFEDINMSHGVLLFTDVPSTSGGYHVEYGYGISRGRTMFIIGPLLNIFHKQANYHFPDWESFKRGYLHAPSRQSTKVQAATWTEEDPENGR